MLGISSFVLPFVIAFVGSGTALQCYNCVGADCGSRQTVENTEVQTCSGAPPSGSSNKCLKSVSNEGVVTRRCHYSSSNKCIKRGGGVVDCYCDQDLCNDAVRPETTLALLTVIGFIVAMVLQ